MTATTAERADTTSAEPTPKRRLQRLGRTFGGDTLAPLSQRLYPPMPNDRFGGWIPALVITAIAGFMRFFHLQYPQKIVFDETYYAKDAYSLLRFGYARQFKDDPKGFSDTTINNLQGHGHSADHIDQHLTQIFQPTPSMVVHPDGGKWQIALGEWLFGMTSFGWRFSSAVAGTLMVLIVIRLTRRLTRSTLIGCIAGILLAFDGLHFVMSRIALVDIFMAAWMIAGVAAIVNDRDWFRKRLVNAMVDGGAIGTVDHVTRFGPKMWFRPWRLVAGVCFGIAISGKWGALYVLAAFGLLSWAWDVSARRALAGRTSLWRCVVFDGIPAFCSLVLVALVTYLLTWSSWFLNSESYGHDWAKQNPPTSTVAKVMPDGLRSFVHFQKDVYEFHTGDFMKKATHPYASKPGGWPFLARPIGFDATNDIKPGARNPKLQPNTVCKAKSNETCVQVISANGNPLIWWAGAIALLACAVFWVGNRDWRFSVPLVGFIAFWVPWFQYQDRTIFFFYAVGIVPFTVIAISLVLGKILGRPDGTENRRLSGGAVVGAYLMLVVIVFAFFYPIYTDGMITRPSWLSRMWLKSWI